MSSADLCVNVPEFRFTARRDERVRICRTFLKDGWRQQEQRNKQYNPAAKESTLPSHNHIGDSTAFRHDGLLRLDSSMCYGRSGGCALQEARERVALQIEGIP